jgi:hypothetical protein
VENLQNKHIKITKNSIKVLGNRTYSTYSKSVINPLTPKLIKFATMDIETISINNNQIPICITSCINPAKTANLFLIDPILLNSNLELSVSKLWESYFNYLSNNKVSTIFVHYLGNFFGFFLYKALSSSGQIYYLKTLSKLK